MIIFKFIGHNPRKQVSKNEQFTCKITNEEFNRIKTYPFPREMETEVIEAKDSGHKSGAKIKLLNPYYEFHHYHVPTFLIENKDDE